MNNVWCVKESAMQFKIEVEQEVDGRWIAEVMDIPGVLVYGKDRAQAVVKAKALALRVLADKVTFLHKEVSA
jgi:predicted RNase H-like HicB family nuclease